MGGSFAGEVSGVELRDGAVEVVKVEHDDRHDPFLGVDLDDVKDFDSNRLWLAAGGEYAKGRGAPPGSQ